MGKKSKSEPPGSPAPVHSRFPRPTAWPIPPDLGTTDYGEALKATGKECDPADLLFESVQAFNKPMIGRRRRFYPADVVAQLVAHGVEVFVGKGRAFTLLKLCVFPWDRIYIGKKKLRAYRDLSRSYIREQVKELLRPFCLICHASTTRKCPDGTHQFCPALFFTVRKHNDHGQWMTYFIPNEAGWDVLLCALFDRARAISTAAEADRQRIKQLRRAAVIKRWKLNREAAHVTATRDTKR